MKAGDDDKDKIARLPTASASSGQEREQIPSRPQQTEAGKPNDAAWIEAYIGRANELIDLTQVTQEAGAIDRNKDALLECLRRTHRRASPDHQTTQIQLCIAVMNRSNASAPPRSFTSPEANGDRGSHASGKTCAILPHKLL